MYTISMYLQFGTLFKDVISHHHGLINSLSMRSFRALYPSHTTSSDS